ncbi:MAG TPA: hypothetical protein VGT24_12675 [Candidatus Acidoferrales bacterium]|nr:hypothetical protein [Candidatus Acidoferrales bacterium]
MNDGSTNEALHGDRIIIATSSSQAVLSGTGTFAASTKLLFILFLLTLPLVNPWVRGDGVGYYAYLRSALIDHDLRFENDYLAGNPSFVLPRVDAQGRILPQYYTRTGYIENHFTVGPAILWAPVMIAVHAAVLIADHFGAHVPADGLSRPYLIAMALTTAIYGFLSLFLAFQIARKYIDPQWAFLATVGIWMATSLPVYMYFNPSWSHAHSAFAVSLFLWYWDRTRLRRTAGKWVILGLMAGLMGNVYYPNVILLIFPGLEILYLLRAERAGSASPRMPVWKIAKDGVLFGTTLIVSLLPTFLTRQIIYGSPFETGYPRISTWNWGSPALFQVLFSSDHGLFIWTPILLLAVAGLFLFRKSSNLLGAGMLLVFLSFYYFIASYPDWDGISSYGNRFFVSLTPIFVLGLAALLKALSGLVGKNSRAAALGAAAVALLSIWNLGFILQWGTHLVPARGPISWNEMVHNQLVVIPSRFTHSLETYFLHRKDMMQHIEEEDVEQQKHLRKPEE